MVRADPGKAHLYAGSLRTAWSQAPGPQKRSALGSAWHVAYVSAAKPGATPASLRPAFPRLLGSPHGPQKPLPEPQPPRLRWPDRAWQASAKAWDHLSPSWLLKAGRSQQVTTRVSCQEPGGSFLEAKPLPGGRACPARQASRRVLSSDPMQVGFCSPAVPSLPVWVTPHQGPGESLLVEMSPPTAILSCILDGGRT